ncbi:hypothetical protein DDB_G0270758 [Dictyostelium discoideum AX4]|uniref:Peptidase S26 domain-containing protein n=1 Tax=Dictyostelium discoideum TaxID=44689 RepID=Q55C48_DICDI|nr:hypothetical protein DDB_G0270758 [Dictyostelium discoideum AX4]EAL72729.1 hypothetical protein DDB_G0270758 [Dictyostelium discoideum AX4]|eukprot:XP_646633.1 hypothetical protein DDB_G0270758 [Dictyostelium discoideum AX4]
MNIKNILNKGIFIVPITVAIHNYLFTIYVDKGEKKINNNSNNNSNNNNSNNNNNDDIHLNPSKRYEMITADKNGEILSISTSTSTNNNKHSLQKANIDKTFKILLINKFSKNYKHNDIVTIIDPDNPNNTLVKKVLATGNEFIPFPPYTNGIQDGFFVYSEPTVDGLPKIAGPIPIGFITGKVITNLYPNKLNIV